MRYLMSLALVLAALWLAVSGVYKPLIFTLGAGSIALVLWLSARMEVVGTEHNPIIYSWRLPAYWAWLAWQIVKSNANVVRAVISPGRVAPRIIRVPVGYQSAVAKVTYANSVTLTPGTVSLYLTDQELTVHALDPYSAEGVKQGDMARRIAWLEGGRARGSAQ